MFFFHSLNFNFMVLLLLLLDVNSSCALIVYFIWLLLAAFSCQTTYVQTPLLILHVLEEILKMFFCSFCADEEGI